MTREAEVVQNAFLLYPWSDQVAEREDYMLDHGMAANDVSAAEQKHWSMFGCSCDAFDLLLYDE